MTEPRTEGPTTDRWPHSLFAVRVAGTGAPLAEAASALLDVLPALLGTQPFSWELGDTSRPRQMALGVPQLAAALARPGGLALVDRPSAWTAMLQIGRSGPRRRETIELSLPGPRQPQLLDLDGMMKLTHTCASALGAHAAYTLDYALGVTYHGRRAMERTERQLAAMPRKGSGSYPKQTFEPIPGVLPGLPELLEPIDFDDALVPDGVYWINWWNPRMIGELGLARIEAAGWARLAHHADGSLTLATSAAPPDLSSAGDVGRLIHLAQALDLRAHQERRAATAAPRGP